MCICNIQVASGNGYATILNNYAYNSSIMYGMFHDNKVLMHLLTMPKQ